MINAITIIGGLYYYANEISKTEEKTVKKNIKAFSTMAHAEDRLKRSQKNAYDKLLVCAKRKDGILRCHLKMFKEQYTIIRKIEFKQGRGIEELKKIDEMQKQIEQYVPIPAISGRKEMTDSQMIISLALNGIGGTLLKDSKMDLKLASRNMAQANAVSAQIDSICIALDGISQHVEIITNLLEKLGMLYMKSIKNITEILKKNGLNPDLYSDKDIEAINMSLALTKLIYRIINTPLIDKDGRIEAESIKVIEEGNNILQSI